MDSVELTDWEALYMIEPLPEDRADLRAGSIASAALAPHMKRGAAPPRPKDFMPDYDAVPDDVRDESPEKTTAMKKTFVAVKKAFGLKQRKKK